MPSKQKIVAVNTFTDGVDTTTDRALLPPTKARYMLNCNILSQGEGNVGIVTNHKGNKQIEFELPAGDNKCIGTATDEENNLIYFFNWNGSGYHTLYQYNSLTKTIQLIFQNLTDTAGVDILRLNKNFLILHANIIDGMLYWVDGLNMARKTNISKLIDKSSLGYGDIIQESFINAYKQTAPLPPTAEYFSDTTKPFNRLYGQITKYAQRFIYDDGEKSVYSDFSAAILPDKEPYNGINTIPTNNNGINITITTGDRLVERIEIVMQSSSGEGNDEGLLPWRLITTIYKQKLNLSDYTSYTYSFYNDGNYPIVDQQEVLQPYIFMPDAPLCQAIAKRALTYASGRQGFPVVDIDASVSVSYSDLFIDDNTDNELNSPVFDYTPPVSPDDYDYVSSDPATRYDGTIQIIPTAYRFIRHTLTIGSDVKKGNKFVFSAGNGYGPDQINFTVEANITDSSITIANKIKAKLIATGLVYRKTPDLPDSNIYDNTVSSGNVTFSYILRAGTKKKGYMLGSTSVEPVPTNSLKDTGQSVRNIKMGSTIKLGIEYEDFDGKKSLTYTTDALVVGIKPVNDDGIKASTIRLQINHKAPVWAKYWQVTRTTDLRYNDFIQILIQSVVDVPTVNTADYLDLVIGSFYTYQKLHPNSTLNFPFEKGDRISLISKPDNSYYDFFETEVISYNETVIDRVRTNVVTNGSASVTVRSTSDGNVGKYILIDGVERLIVAVTSSTVYLLDNVIGETTPKTYLFYDLIDRRGTLRIRKPSVTIEPNSIIEIYKPSSASNTDKTFYEFQKKFPIINPGTINAYHGGNPQDQSSILPALVDISEGTVYVRSREMPVNNIVPDTQVIISTVEDPSYSDFYPSLFNDNGRVNAEDNGQGVVHFGSRIWYSNNYIENTQINGLGYFTNTNREDYDDEYGNIMLTKFEMNRIFIFKQLRTAYVTVDAVMTQDNAGSTLLITTSKLLNPIQYFAWEGGIGNNPESWVSDGTHQYFVSTNSGVVIRLGGDGGEPISKTYFLDNDTRSKLSQAADYNAKIFGGFDRKNGVYLYTIENYSKYTYSNGYQGWRVTIPTPDATYEIVGYPNYGEVDFTDHNLWIYTPNTDYIGSDFFTYRAFYNGVWTSPIKVCLNIVENLNRQTSWRPIDPTCLTEDGVENGFASYSTLEQYYLDDNSATGATKPNVPTDANYVAPIIDPISCPFSGTRYYSIEKTASAQKECSEGLTGTFVELISVAGKFQSVISQVEADQKATDWLNENKQENANLYGFCNPILYWNIEVSEDFTKNNCPEGTVPSTTTVTVEAHTYSSTESQEAANAIATTFLAEHGQEIANEEGECTVALVGNDYMAQSFTKDDCTPPLVGSSESYEVAADSYFASTKEAANLLAQEEIDANGQDFANTNGTCEEEPSYGNQLQFKYFTKSGCESPSVGTKFYYEVAPNTYYASTQAAANALAIAYLDTNGQTMADEDPAGICYEHPTVPCGMPQNLSYYPSDFVHTIYFSFGELGDTTNQKFLVSFDSYSVPDKYVFYDADDNEVYNTGYRGDSSYQSILDARLTELGWPLETIVGDSIGYFSIDKTWADKVVKMIAYMPIAVSIASLTVSCLEDTCVLDISTSKTDETDVDENDGTITITVEDGTGALEFSKDNGITWVSGTSPFTFAGLSPGTYNVKAKDSLDCVGSSTIVIEEFICTIGFTFTVENESAEGENDGQINVTAYNYEPTTVFFSKDDGATWIEEDGGDYSFINLAPGTYPIRVKDYTGCISDVQNVVVEPYHPPCALSISTEKTDETDVDENDGTITITVEDGTGALEFSKDNGITWVSGTSPFTFDNLPPNTYIVKARDENNCTDDDSVTINPYVQFFKWIIDETSNYCEQDPPE